MARKKSGIGKFGLIGIIVVVISIVGLILTTQQSFISSAQENFGFFVERITIPMTLVKNVNILCVVDPNIEILDVNNVKFPFSNAQPSIIDLFTNFQVTGLVTTSSTIKELIPTVSVKCDPQVVDVSINLAGGWTNTKWEVEDQNGVYKTISQITQSIPSTVRSIKSTTVNIPSDPVTASEIEKIANLQGILSKNVKVRMTFSTNLVVLTSATGTLQNTGGVSSASSGYVKIIVSQPPPTSSQGKLVDITAVNPSAGFCFDGGASTSCATSTTKEVPNGGTMTLTVTGKLDQWTTTEGLPFIRIYGSDGRQVGTDIIMTTQGATDSTGTTFQRINFDIAKIISTTSIATSKGTWNIEMHSNSDIRKSSTGTAIVDRYPFTLKDVTQVTAPICTGGQIVDTTTNKCVTPSPEPPSEPTCDADTVYQAEADKLTDDVLKLTITTLEGITSRTTCQQKQLDIYKAEATSRGLDTGVTTGAGITEAKVFANVIGQFAPSGASPNPCQDIRQVPEIGLSLPTAFQLTGTGGKCSGYRWVETEIRPVIDFGSVVKDVSISSVVMDHDLFISKNSPFPEKVEFDCIGGSATPLTPKTCVIKNYDATKLVPIAGLKFDQVTKINQFTDQATSGQYQLSLVKFTEGDIVDQIRIAGQTLQVNDIYSYMLVANGVFTGTYQGKNIVGIVAPLAITQDFTFTEGVLGCNANESYDQASNICKPIQKRTCVAPTVYDEATDSCVGGTDPPVECSEIPECIIGETLENTGRKDACTFDIYECKPVEVGINSPLPEDQPKILSPNQSGGCISGYVLNTLKQCQLIGSSIDDPPEGTSTGGGFCDAETYDFGKCFASLFKPKGDETGGFQITGATLLGIIIFVVVIIILVIVAVVIRRRRGGGGIIP